MAWPQLPYNIPIFISGGSSAKTNYQIVNYTVPCLRGMRANFGDCVFCDADGNQLSYVLEGFSYGNYAKFTILLPTHPTDGQVIYLFWGDPATVQQVNGTDKAVSKTYSSTEDRIITISQADKLTKFYFNQTGVEISFDLADLPRGLTYFNCQGSNTVSGDIANLPRGLTYFVCEGSNTISGNLADLPSGLTSFDCYGSNTITGDIANLPSGLTTLYMHGQNTIYGDLADLPSGLTVFYCIGLNQISTYTPGKTWPSIFNRLHLQPASGYGLDSNEVDNLLIDMANSITTATGSKEVWVAGNNAPRTSASDSAVTTLQSLGFTVTTN